MTIAFDLFLCVCDIVGGPLSIFYMATKRWLNNVSFMNMTNPYFVYGMESKMRIYRILRRFISPDIHSFRSEMCNWTNLLCRYHIPLYLCVCVCVCMLYVCGDGTESMTRKQTIHIRGGPQRPPTISPVWGCGCACCCQYRVSHSCSDILCVCCLFVR